MFASREELERLVKNEELFRTVEEQRAPLKIRENGIELPLGGLCRLLPKRVVRLENRREVIGYGEYEKEWTIFPAESVDAWTEGQIRIPEEYNGLIYSTTDAALHGLGVTCPPLPSGYNGSIEFGLNNHASFAIKLKKGDPIALLYLTPTTENLCKPNYSSRPRR